MSISNFAGEFYVRKFNQSYSTVDFQDIVSNHSLLTYINSQLLTLSKPELFVSDTFLKSDKIYVASRTILK